MLHRENSQFHTDPRRGRPPQFEGVRTHIITGQRHTRAFLHRDIDSEQNRVVDVRAPVQPRRKRQILSSVPHYVHELARLRNRQALAAWTYYKFPYLFPLRDFPTVIELELTNECNFSCPHCPRTVFNKANSLGFMSLRLFRTITEQSAGRISLMKFCGLGEPALHPHLDIMIRLLQLNNIPLALYTNGTLFDRHTRSEILDWNIDQLVISVDGTDERTFQRLRVGGNYRRIRAKVSDLRDARAKAGKRLPYIEIRHVIMPNETPAMLKEFRDDWTHNLGDTVKFNLLEITVLPRHD